MQVTRYSDDVIQAHDFNLNLHPVFAVNDLLINEQTLDHFFRQMCLRVITL